MDLPTIQKIAKNLAKKYSFGYYDSEDIEQECFIFALEAIINYDSNKGSFENFLYSHLSNRLKNLLRNNYYRHKFDCQYSKNKDPDCIYCQKRKEKFIVKKHLIEPIDIDNVNDCQEKNMSVTYNFLENLEIDEIFGIINKELEIELRPDYLKILEGHRIPLKKRRIIEEKIKEILRNYGYLE